MINVCFQKRVLFPDDNSVKPSKTLSIVLTLRSSSNKSANMLAEDSVTPAIPQREPIIGSPRKSPVSDNALASTCKRSNRAALLSAFAPVLPHTRSREDMLNFVRERRVCEGYRTGPGTNPNEPAAAGRTDLGGEAVESAVPPSQSFSDVSTADTWSSGTSDDEISSSPDTKAGTATSSRVISQVRARREIAGADHAHHGGGPACDGHTMPSGLSVNDPEQACVPKPTDPKISASRRPPPPPPSRKHKDISVSKSYSQPTDKLLSPTACTIAPVCLPVPNLEQRRKDFGAGGWDQAPKVAESRRDRCRDLITAIKQRGADADWTTSSKSCVVLGHGPPASAPPGAVYVPARPTYCVRETRAAPHSAKYVGQAHGAGTGYTAELGIASHTAIDSKYLQESASTVERDRKSGSIGPSIHSIHTSESPATERVKTSGSYGISSDDDLDDSSSCECTPWAKAKVEPVCQPGTTVPNAAIYLEKLLGIDTNTTASKRLLRILKDELVGLDTSLGLKLLDLAAALRADGELAPPPAQSMTSLLMPDIQPIQDRLNDFAGMLNVIAEAVGVDVLEDDEDISSKRANNPSAKVSPRPPAPSITQLQIRKDQVSEATKGILTSTASEDIAHLTNVLNLAEIRDSAEQLAAPVVENNQPSVAPPRPPHLQNDDLEPSEMRSLLSEASPYHLSCQQPIRSSSDPRSSSSKFQPYPKPRSIFLRDDLWSVNPNDCHKSSPIGPLRSSEGNGPDHFRQNAVPSNAAFGPYANAQTPYSQLPATSHGAYDSFRFHPLTYLSSHAPAFPHGFAFPFESQRPMPQPSYISPPSFPSYPSSMNISSFNPYDFRYANAQAQNSLRSMWNPSK